MVGGAIGVPSGIAGARQGVADIDSLRARGLTDAQIRDTLSQTGARGLTDLVTNTREVDQFSQPAPQVEEPAPEVAADVPEPDGTAGDRARLDQMANAARQAYDNAADGGVDAETLAELAKERNDIVALRQAYDRISREEAQINELEKSNDINDLKRAAARRAVYEEYTSRLRRMLNGTAEIEDADEFLAAMERDGFGMRTEGEAAPAPETSVGEAPSTSETDAPAAEEAAPAEGSEAPVTTVTTEESPTPTPPKTLYADLPFRSKGQQTEITNLLTDKFTEEDLAQLFDEGKIEVGRDGKFTRKSIAAIKAARDLKDDVQETTLKQAGNAVDDLGEALQEPDAELPSITPELRGRALASGIDWRELSGNPSSSGNRITKGTVSNAVKANKGNPVSGYAKQVSDELDEILDMVDVDDSVGIDTIRQAIPVIARNPQFKSDADDILALFEHNLRDAEAAPEPKNFKEENDVFTKTEQKRIKRLANVYKKQIPDLSDDAAENMARLSVKRNRGAEAKTTTRSAQTGIDNKGIFETAGRNRQGRIQGILRRGTPISKGSDYTTSPGQRVSKTEFARQEAMLKAASGKGPDLVPYTTEYPEQAFSPNGKVDVAKGTTLWADAVTGRVYTSQNFAMQVRGDAGKKYTKRPSNAPKPTEDAPKGEEAILGLLNNFGEDGDPEAFVKALMALKRGEADASTPTPQPKVSPPVQKGNTKLIVQSRSRPDDVRMISQQQIKDGKDISAIIGQKAGSPDSDPANWLVRYAPMEAVAKNARARKKLFDTLPDEQTSRGEGARYEVGDQKGSSTPITEADFSARKVTITPEEDEILKRVERQTIGKFPRETDADGNTQIDGDTVITAISKLDNRRWPTKEVEFQQMLDDLEGMYAIQARMNPEGFARPVQERELSIQQLDQIFAGHSSDELARAKEFISALGGDPSTGPIFSRKADGDYYRVATNEVNIDSGVAKMRLKPKLNTLYHEVAHWAYRNILTPEDRLEFMRIAKQNYKDGKFSRSSLEEQLPINRGKMGSPMGEISVSTNSGDNAQELFANSFDVWATRRRGTSSGEEEKFWRKVADYVKAVFDRYFGGAKIDPALEPLFAKILPDVAEERTFALGVGEEPRSPQGIQIHKRFIQLKMAEMDLEDAFTSDSADGIITAHQSLVKLLLEMVPNSKLVAQEGRSVIFGPLTKTRGRMGMVKIVRNRINDLDEIMLGKQFGEDTDFNARVYEGMSSRADPQKVADQLRDFFYNGYKGTFEPAEGIPGRVRNLDATSTRSLVDQLYKTLNTAYQIAEKNADILPDSTPRSATRRKEPPVRADGTVRPSSTKRQARKEAETRNARTEAQAKADATTPRKNRTRTSGKNTPVVDTSLAQTPKGKSMQQLRQLYVKHKGTDYGDQIGMEIVSKAKTASVPAKQVVVPREVFKMNTSELETELLEALYVGDKDRISQVHYELSRRGHNKRARKSGGKIITPRFKETLEFVAVEKNDNTGVMTNDAVPPAARASVREMLTFITHRQPEVEQASRSIAYRMLNILNKTSRGTMQDSNRVSMETMARLGGTDYAMEGSGVFGNYGDQSFKNFRTSVRRISAAMNKGSGDATDAMRNLNKMIIRSGAIPQDEVDVIVSAYRAADDTVRSRIESQYGSQYSDFTDMSREEMLAFDWFGDSLTDYMGERIVRDDILENAVSGDGNIMDISTLDRAIDRTAEYASYVLNGQVGRQDVKEAYRRISFYGDMFEDTASAPLAGTLNGRYLTHPTYAADYAFDSLNSMSPSRYAKIMDFVKGGAGHDEVAQTPKIFYHGTPRGNKLSLEANPNVIMRPSRVGFYGPGVYVTENPYVATQIYSERPTFESVIQQIDELDIPQSTKEELHWDAYELIEARTAITRMRRDFSNMATPAIDGNDIGERAAMREILRNDIAELVEDEMAIVKRMTDAGVETDPLVMPMAIQLRNPFDFREAVYYSGESEALKAVTAGLNETADVKAATIRQIYEKLDSHGEVSGQELYKLLVSSLVASGRSKPAAQKELNGLLEAIGYDGLLTTQRNSLDDPATEMLANNQATGASIETHTSAVLFKPNQAKHVDAAEFDEMHEGLYHETIEVNAVPRGIVGGITESLMESSDSISEAIPTGQFGELLEQEGANSTFTGALMSMVRNRDLTPQEEQAVRKAGVSRFFRSQSSRMRRMGAKTLGDWYEGHFPEMNQRFAKVFYPIMNSLDKLPDSDGTLRRYFRRSTASVMQPQPKSHTRIVKALRRGDGSRQERALTDQERVIYRQIRATLANERTEMIDSGFHVGDRGPNYLPQVWNQNKIRKNRVEFEDAMKRYFIIERAENGLTATDEEATAFAQGMVLRLTDEGTDGVFMPVKGTTKNPTFENVDYSRVIELDKYINKYSDELSDLEGFLEDDLEAILVKYLEGSSRRLTHAKELGVNSHAVSDYLTVANEGLGGITRLLTTNRQFKRDISSMSPDGVREVATLTDIIKMPFENSEADAMEFAQRLLNTSLNEGSPAARQLLYSVAPTDPRTGRMNITYKRRADAIVNALEDFKGRENSISPDDEKFIEDSMRVAMKKPMLHTGGKDVMNASRSLRFFNNVTLLGFTTLTSLGDVVLPIIRSGNFTAWRKGLGEFATDPEYREILRGVGVAMENIIHERMIHLYGAPDGKASHAFFNATLLTPWTDMNRMIAGATGHQSFKSFQSKAFNEFKEGVPYSQQTAQYKTAHRFLKNYGLEAFLPGGERAGESLGSRALMQDDETVRMAIIRFADDAIFQPNPDDVPMFAQTPLGALVFQLKSFPLMMTRLGGHVISEANKGNLRPLAYLATLGPAFGAVTLSVKDIVQMRGGDDERSSEIRKRNLLKALGYDQKIHGDEQDFLGWYVEGMMVMGGLGLLGDVIHSTVSQVDNGAYGQQRIWSTLLGPTFGLGNAALTVGAGLTDAKESNAKERSAAREVATRIPVVGGVRAAREKIVDTVAGEQKSGSSGGWTSNWTSDF